MMMVLSSFSCLTVLSSAAVIEGGEIDGEGNLAEKQWEYDDVTKAFTVVADITNSSWKQYKDEIVKIVVDGSVSKIDDHVFSRLPSLTEVEFIGEDIASVGDYAFQECPKLEKVTLPRVKGIGDYAFYNCDALKIVIIEGDLYCGDDGEPAIGKNIFKSCDSLENVDLWNSVATIGEGMFEDCVSLSSIEIPDSVEEIGRLAFENCSSLEDIYIPDSVEKVGEYAFYDCSSAKSVYVGHNVNTIGEYVFGRCTSLESVEIKCAMPTISEGMFYGCSSLTGLPNLPDGVKVIGKNAFKDCTSFAEFVVPSTVTAIGDSAFDATVIEKINIPVGVETIGAGVFTNCLKLEAINVEAKNRNYASVDGVLYDANIQNLICCPAGKTGTVVIPENATSIGNDAFIGCTGIDVVEIPASVTEIAPNAFNGCADDLVIKTNCDSYAASYAKIYAIDTDITHSKISDWVVTVEPDCNNPGTKEKQCLACGNVEETGIVDALGHNYNAGVVTKKATCLEDGVVTFTCQNDGCGDSYTEVIPATGHNYDDGTVILEPTCDNDGTKRFRCKNEGCYNYYEITLPATGHNLDAGTVVVEATCTTPGSLVRKCKDEKCGYEISVVIPAIGHDYDEGEVTLAPGCETKGVKTFTCKNGCGTPKTEEIPAIGHNYDEGVITKYPTVKADGEITYTCQNDETHSYVVYIPNNMFDGILDTNEGAYADEKGFQNLTWLVTDTYDLYIYANDTAEEWAGYRDDIVSATIMGDATIVENGSFAYAKSLKEVNILFSLGTIEAYAFQYCESLETVRTGSIEELQDFAFYHCSALENVDIYGGLPEGKVGRNVFLDCVKLSNVVLRNGTLSLGEAMFKGCSSLEEIILPESLLVIGDSAFDGTAIKTIRIPTDVKEINKGAFTKCTVLEEIVVDSKNDNYFSFDGVLYDMSLGSLLLCPAGKKGEVTVWDNTTKIADDAFIGCVNVTKVKIPSTVTEIADNAFNGCAEALVIACDCDSYAAEFANSRGIAVELTHTGNQVWQIITEATCTENGSKALVCSACEYSYETQTILALGHKYDKGVVTLEPTCEDDGEKLFTCQNGCGDTYTEVIPAIGHDYDEGVVTKEPTCDVDGVKTFTCKNGCGDTYTEVIPGIGHDYDEGVVTKEPDCVNDGVKTFTCKNGCGATYTEAVPAIGHSYDAGVITKAPTLNEDGEKTFTCQNAGCGHTYIEAIPNVAFDDILAINDGAYADEEGKIHNVTWYLTKSGELYVYADGTEAEWEDHKASIKKAIIAKTVSTIGKNAFMNCTALEEVSLAEGVEVLEKNAFKGCSALKEIKLPETLNTIGDSAFDGTSLKEIFIPADVDIIEKGVFTNCDELEAINVDNKNDNYFSVDGVLYDMSLGSLLLCPAGKKGEVTVWDNTTKIADDAFIGCVNVTKVIIPATVNEIADNAFNGCSDALVIACDCDSYAAEFASSRGFATEITHTGSQVWNITAEATCTTDGSKELECSSCGYVYEKVTILALGHKFDKGVVTLEPTCEDDGEKLFTCQNGCGDTYTEVVPAIGHDYDKGIVTLKPTCEEDGEKTFTCKNNCGSTYTEVISATGHDYDKGVVTLKPTCEEEGEKTFTCKNNCGSKYTEDIAATGHNYVSEVVKEGTCITKGIVEYKCENCDDSYDVKEYGEHQLYSSPVRIEPTCDADGKEGEMCALCREFVGEVTVLPATGHIAGKWIVDKKATCENAGSKHTECTSCGEVLETAVIVASGHSESEWITDKKATTSAAGKKHKVCTECGETIETAKIAQLKCSKPQLKKVSNGSKGAKISWSKVSGADYYRIYRKTKNGSWEYIDSTKKTSYVDDTVKSGTKYYYAVRAKNEAGVSELSNSLSRYYLADPVLKSPTSTKSGVTLKWSKVTGAEGYIVYRKTESGSYKKIKIIEGTSKTTYTDKSAKKGTKYTYKVKAFYSKTTSDYSRTRSITDKY